MKIIRRDIASVAADAAISGSTNICGRGSDACYRKMVLYIRHK
ncbi:hypothetical protein Arad_7762 [Rhizobium rhizogenes K84]|uniref:Uncharacterized protein n=1 Tax=Rhizobium rhizogenes (strain K84 / ATCC BAA-868) TaxID=311403 RepID=B9JNR7_RHIR8|nr:hypothetical protein Arad_7762 [Rhizobium rhizogenes K84]